jgi:hypothetical protein
MMTSPPTRFPNGGPAAAGMDPVGSVFCTLHGPRSHKLHIVYRIILSKAYVSRDTRHRCSICHTYQLSAQRRCVPAPVAGFNQGCSPGCPTCSFDACDKYTKNGFAACCENPMEPTLNASGPAELSPRTFNDSEVDSSGSGAGLFRYHPWRAPGYAPVGDPW